MRGLLPNETDAGGEYAGPVAPTAATAAVDRLGVVAVKAARPLLIEFAAD